MLLSRCLSKRSWLKANAPKRILPLFCFQLMLWWTTMNCLSPFLCFTSLLFWLQMFFCLFVFYSFFFFCSPNSFCDDSDVAFTLNLIESRLHQAVFKANKQNIPIFAYFSFQTIIELKWFWPVPDNPPSNCWQTGEKNDGTNVKDAEGRWPWLPLFCYK